MRGLDFMLIGTVGILVLLLLGNRLNRNPQITSGKFAFWMAGSFAALIFILVLTRGADMVGIVLACILFAIHFGIGYPTLKFLHRRVLRQTMEKK